MLMRRVLWFLGALAGVVLAAGVTYAASSLSTPKVGLSAEPPSAGADLAPRATATPTPKPKRTPTPKPKRKPKPRATPRPSPTTVPVPTAAPTVDDHGGDDSSGKGSGGKGRDHPEDD
jgi:outer membrane biosynthesis protein TonB